MESESKIFITEEIKRYAKGIDILKKIKNYNIISSEEEFVNMIKSKKLTYTEEKSYMFFGVKKGKFLKEYHLDEKFRGIKEEYYLSYENNCPFNCLYCYLREYYGHGAFVFYVNIEDMFSELDEFKKKNAMISCGIVNDSLVLDSITEITKDLIKYFKKREDLILEIRSKSKNISNLIELGGSENIITSFTFSPQEVIEKYELGTASLNERVEAAVKLQQAGFKIGIRIDPMINIEECNMRYSEMIEKIFSNLDRSKIANIGIGSMRYRKGLKQLVTKERKTDLFYGEIITGIDGKERYFKKIRLDMYKNAVKEIRKYGNFEIYLGMEPDYVWNEVFR
jgi:spore photoproduct lyase